MDDGSTDGSAPLARRLSASDGRFRVFECAHRGLVATLSAGTALCTAPVIARMDADDWMHPDRLALQLAALRESPELDAVGCHVRIFPREGLMPGRLRYEAWLNSLRCPDDIRRNRFIECPVAHPTLAIRREILEGHPYRDRGWPEDYDLILRLLRRGPHVGIVPEPLLAWRDHPERLSRTHPAYELDRLTACRAWHLSRDFLRDAPEYVLWGHGRTGRALRRALAGYGHRPVSIVDVHPRRIGNVIHGAEVIPPEALGERRGHRIVASVAGSEPRGEIRAALTDLGFIEDVDFVCAA